VDPARGGVPPVPVKKPKAYDGFGDVQKAGGVTRQSVVTGIAAGLTRLRVRGTAKRIGRR
jgi:hypothetical protein